MELAILLSGIIAGVTTRNISEKKKVIYLLEYRIKKVICEVITKTDPRTVLDSSDINNLVTLVAMHLKVEMNIWENDIYCNHVYQIENIIKDIITYDRLNMGIKSEEKICCKYEIAKCLIGEYSTKHHAYLKLCDLKYNYKLSLLNIHYDYSTGKYGIYLNYNKREMLDKNGIKYKKRIKFTEFLDNN